MVVLTASFTRKCETGKSRSHNGGARPNSIQRRANKMWLLTDEFWGGNGIVVPCGHCGCPLTFEQIEADRAKPGSKGGGYQQRNLIPSCKPCNRTRGDKSLWSFNPNLARRMARRDRKAGHHA
jgi:hypothetical protein